MTPSTILLIDEAIKLLPVIAGGLLTILGGAGSQYLIYRLNKGRDRKMLLRDRAEALVKALYAHTDWLDEKRNNLLYRQKDHDAPSPLDAAKMIQRLYFPELSNKILAVVNAQAPMVQFLYDQRIAQINDLNAWLEDNDQSPYKTMYAKYLVSFHECVDEASLLVQSHIND